MEKYILTAIGIMLILMVVTIAIMIFYVTWKLALPKIKSSRQKYMIGGICFILLALGVSKCLMLGIELVSLSN